MPLHPLRLYPVLPPSTSIRTASFLPEQPLRVYPLRSSRIGSGVGFKHNLPARSEGDHLVGLHPAGRLHPG